MTSLTFSLHDKAAIFIDGENIEKLCGRGRVDYSDLVRCVAQGRRISDVLYFDTKFENDPIQEKRYEQLRKNKIRIMNPRGRCGNNAKQMGVDVYLATEVTACAMTSHCDTIIIVSGDGDFIPVIDRVRQTGKNIEFASWDECANKSLVDECSHFIHLDDLPILYPEEGL